MQALTEYLEALASDRATPGGGSAANVVAAIGASLVGMVARICGQSQKYAVHRDLLADTVHRADALRENLLARRSADEAAFEQVVRAQSLPKEGQEAGLERSLALEVALAHAADVPLESAQLILATLHACRDLLAVPNRNLVSDIGCAAEFASAAIAANAYNVRINHRYMHAEDTVARQERQLAACEAEAAGMVAEIRAKVAGAMGKDR